MAPRSARRGATLAGPALHGEVVFPIRNDAKVMEKSWLVGHRFGLDWETRSYITFISADSELELPFTGSSMHWPSVWF